MTESKEVEYSRLASQVAEIEKLIRSGQRSDAGYLLAPFLENARARMDVIRFDETRVRQETKERKDQETAAIAVQVECEKNLNAEEKQQYGEFLKQEYFTKANFCDLEKFYANSWDKLSENGKAEMSHRVWEGIRRDEYRFEEMPEELRRKEAEHLYQQLSGKIEADTGLKNIPQQDRDDFIREQKSGNREAVAEVLSRKVFTENVSSRSDSAKLAESQSVGNEPDRHERRSAVGDTTALTAISPVQCVDDVTVPQVSAKVNATPTTAKAPNAASVR